MRTTLYEVLGISHDASLEDIAAAYETRKAALQDELDAESQAQLKLVRQAYSILFDPAQREKYDQRLRAETAQEHRIASYEAAPERSGGALKWLVMVALVAGGYLAYQHYGRAGVTPASQAAAPTGEPAKAAESAASAAPQAFADINDVNAVPITPAQRGTYQNFLSQSSPRAFVICSNGNVTTINGPQDFVKVQLASQPAGCLPYAINDKVVWSGK